MATDPVPGTPANKALGERLENSLLGLYVASAVAAAMLLAVRAGIFVWLLMVDPASTKKPDVPPLYNVVPEFVRWLAEGGLFLPIPGWLSLPVIVGAGVYLVAFVKRWPAKLAGVIVLGLFAVSLLQVSKGLGGALVLMMGAWIVPTLGLTLLVPYLKPGGEMPRWWGVLAFLGGVAIAVWVALALSGDVGLRAALAGLTLATVAGTGVLIWRRVPMSDLWPLMAITVSLFLVGGSTVFQNLTFAGVANSFHPLQQPSDQSDPDEDFWTVSPYGALPPGFVPAETEDDIREGLRLELALSGAIGFWLTLALLATWSLKQAEPKQDSAEALLAPHPDALRR